MRPWPAGAEDSEAGTEGGAQITSQDDAPLCFRRFEGYYSSWRPGAWMTGWFETFWRANAQAAPGYV